MHSSRLKSKTKTALLRHTPNSSRATHAQTASMHMEPGSMQDGVVNMTRAKEALSPWLNHPRKTIIQVEGLVLAAAALLLLQLILGTCRRKWHNSFIKYGLQVCNEIMFPLIVYTLGTMQSSPIKNSLYPVWAGFLIMASAGTNAVWQYDFYDSFYSKYMHAFGVYLRDAFYALMFLLLIDPSTYTMKTAMNDPKQFFKYNARASSHCVMVLVFVVVLKNFFESFFLVVFGYGYKMKGGLFVRKKKSRHTHDAEPETREETAASRKNGCMYAVCYRLCQPITNDQIRDYYGNLADGNALKDVCLSFDLFLCLLRQRYFGLVVSLETGRLNAHDYVFKKLLSSEEGFIKVFRVIETELGFCYDFFFTKYYYTFTWMRLLPGPFILPLILLKIILILMVGVFAIRKSLVLETPNPIIEVHNSKADYIITLLVLDIALLVELVQSAFYMASNLAQVSLACMHLKKCFHEPNAFIFGKIIGFLRMVRIYGQLRNKIDQHSIIFRWKQPSPVEVSDAVKKAIGRSLSSAYDNNPTTNGEISVRLQQNQMFDQYFWALKDLSQLEVMLIWHIATEYCEYDVYNDPSNGTTGSSNHQGAHLFGYVVQLFHQHPGRNRIARDDHRGVAVHLSRYCAYLIGSIPELLPYHEADIAELAEKVMEEHEELFGSSYKHAEIYSKMTQEEEEDDPRKIFQKGVKLGKQLKSQPDADCWEVLKDFWSETIIHVAASHYTTKQHMQHLENGGEFLTHIWALIAHAGILMKLSRNKEQEGQANPGSGPEAPV